MKIDDDAAAKSIAKVTRRLDKMARELGSTWTCVVALPPSESRKLTFFDSGTRRQPARPVFTLTTAARAEILGAVRARFTEAMLRSETPSMLPVMMVAASAFRRVWVRRLETSGGNTPFAPLSPRYAQWKSRKGLDPRIGVAHGLMLAAVRKGQIVVRKK